MRHFAITGATGYLGSRIASQLLLHGWSCSALVRDRPNQSSSQRLLGALAPGIDATKVHCIPGDLAAGIANTEQAFHAPVDAFIHCAAMVKTSMDSREIFMTNVEGTREALRLAEKLGASTFIHIGTAYSCGRGPREEQELIEIRERTRLEGFNNTYEQSKALAESLVRESKLNWTIFRPTILCHSYRPNSIDSMTQGDDLGLVGWFHLVNAIHRIAKKQNINSIRIPGSMNAHVNLLDVDEFAAFVAKLIYTDTIDSPHFVNREYLVANRHETKVQSVIEKLMASGLDRMVLKEELFNDLNVAERIYAKQGQFFTSYMNQFIRFNTNSLQAVLAELGWSYPFRAVKAEECEPWEQPSPDANVLTSLPSLNLRSEL